MRDILRRPPFFRNGPSVPGNWCLSTKHPEYGDRWYIFSKDSTVVRGFAFSDRVTQEAYDASYNSVRYNENGCNHSRRD